LICRAIGEVVHVRRRVEPRVDLEKRISRCVAVTRVGVRRSGGNRGKESAPRALDRCRGVRVVGCYWGKHLQTLCPETKLESVH